MRAIEVERHNDIGAIAHRGFTAEIAIGGSRWFWSFACAFVVGYVTRSGQRRMRRRAGWLFSRPGLGSADGAVGCDAALEPAPGLGLAEQWDQHVAAQAKLAVGAKPEFAMPVFAVVGIGDRAAENPCFAD